MRGYETRKKGNKGIQMWQIEKKKTVEKILL